MNDDELQTELLLTSHTYMDRVALLTELTGSIDGAGGWLLERRQVSAIAVELSLEVQQQCLPEMYAALLGSGLELSKESHRVLAERCNCCMYLPKRRGASSILTMHLEVQFLADPQQTADVAHQMTMRPATA